MTAAELVAMRFTNRHRRRREQRRGSGEPLLSLWATWDDVVGQCAESVADDVINDWPHCLIADAEAYKIAKARQARARARYAAHDRAKRAAAAS